MKQKQTKIVCTIGPSCEDEKILTQMVEAGMNVARLNFSHGTHENHKLLIDRLRSVEKKTGYPIAILQDLQGPKIRIGEVDHDGIELKQNDEIVFSTEKNPYQAIPIQYETLHKYVQKGELMLLDDGKIEVVITAVKGKRIHAKVVVGGVLTSHKGINIPDSDLTQIKVLTDKDKEDVLFGLRQGVDMIAMSFIMKPKDILDMRYYIKQAEKKLKIKNNIPISIIAKIEKKEAVQGIEDILSVVDGIMIARGDLGVEIPAEEVPLAQKKLIDAALEHAKPVIVATQMLDSMQHNPRPTRAEVSDVSNAVMDHTDAVMLSNETASGKYPVITVQTMARIIIQTEKSHYDDLYFTEPHSRFHKIDDTISGLSRIVAEKIDAKLILAASITGETARLISRYRPEFPIMIATTSDLVRHQLCLSWGVHPFILAPCDTIEELVERSIQYLKQEKDVVSGDNVIVVAGEPVGHSGYVNVLEVREVS